MKKLLLLAAAALTSLGICANAVLPSITEIKGAETTFTQSKTSLSRPGALMLPGVPAKSFTLNSNGHGRMLVQSRAEKGTKMPYSYAGEPYSLDAIPQLGEGETATVIAEGTRVYLAFAMLTDDIKLLAGNKVTEVTLVTSASNDIATNPIPDVEFFITSNFGAKYDYTQSMNLGEQPFAEVTVPLTTPYVIPEVAPEEEQEGKAVIFGYSFIVPAGENFWLPFDYIQAPTQLAGLISATNDKALVANIGETAPTSWATFTSMVGSLCMYLTLEGDNLPQNVISPLTYEGATYTKPGEKSNLLVLYENKGANNIEGMGVTASVNGGTEAKYDGIIFDYETMEPGATKPGARGLAVFQIPIPADVEGTADIKFTIDRINDAEGKIIDGSYQILSYNTGYDRKVVFEDATGNWCGWCPAGMVMLEYLKETYPEALLIGVHSNQSSATRDPMTVSAYANAIAGMIQGYPAVLVNRYDVFSPGGRNEAQLKAAADDYMEQMTSYPAYGTIEFTAEKRSSSSLNVSARVNFSVSLAEPHSVTFVTIQDEAGPYNQTNYFTKGMAGNIYDIGEWNDAPASVSTMYNDVARGYKANVAVADAVEKGKEYVTTTTTVSYSKVDATKPHRVAALLINDTTGEIVNATVMECLEGDSAGVEGVIAGDSDADITIGAGSISVTGATTVAVYSLDGRKVADGDATGLAAGIYIVVADGQSTKVAVY